MSLQAAPVVTYNQRAGAGARRVYTAVGDLRGASRLCGDRRVCAAAGDRTRLVQGKKIEPVTHGI